MNRKIFAVLIFMLCLFVSHADSSEQIRIGVMPFVSRTKDLTARQASGISDIIAGFLHVSPSISVMERERLRVIAIEHGFGEGNLNQNSAVEAGKLAGCKYILLGSVTNLSQRYSSSGKSSSAFQYGKLMSTIYFVDGQFQETTATLEARLVDVETGRVVLSFSRSGTAFITNDDGKTHSANELSMRALTSASSRLADKVREVAAGEKAMIISVSKNNIRINRGSASGVTQGTLYRVYRDGEEIKDINGKSLGRKTINLGVIRVTEANSEFSIAEEVKVPDDKKKKQKSRYNQITFHEGDKIEVISLTEAEKMQ